MNIITLALLLLFTMATVAQSNSINYKALIKDANNAVVSNTPVTVQFGILQGVAQTNVYQETHTPTTDANGIIIINIGEGVVNSGVYAGINWASDDHFLNTQINSGSGLTDMGTTGFNAVPYALSAKTAENVSGLEVNGNGLAIIGRNEANYGTVGPNAVDLSFSIDVSTTSGATGENSIALGNFTRASGIWSTAMGSQTTASGISSTAMGESTNASGDRATAMGRSTTAESFGQTTLGLHNVPATPINATGFEGLDRLLVVGNGEPGASSDALVILKNGIITAPSLDIAEITDAKALVTKEYIDLLEAKIAILELRLPITVPDAPTIGTATSGDRMVAVAFTAPLNNGGSPITEYTAISAPGGITGTINQAESGTIIVSGLTNGTAYTFSVTATNAIGISNGSTISNSVIPLTVSVAPTIGTATSGDGEVSVAFTAPFSDGGSPITGYTATSSPGGLTGTVSQAGSGIIIVSGLTNGTAYTFSVTATNGVGISNPSAASNSVIPSQQAAIGDIRNGGVVFWVDPIDNTHGLVCAYTDFANSVVWGCNVTDLPNVPNVTGNIPTGAGAEIGDGVTNTNNILINCSNAPAALASRFLGPEWFLPSANELNEMYVNKAVLEAVPGFVAFQSAPYFSSTEFDSEFVWLQNLLFGAQYRNYKRLLGRVRAVRAF